MPHQGQQLFLQVLVFQCPLVSSAFRWEGFLGGGIPLAQIGEHAHDELQVIPLTRA